MQHERENGTITSTSVDSSHHSVGLMADPQTAPAPALASAVAPAQRGPRVGLKFLSMFPDLPRPSFNEDHLMELGRRMEDSPGRDDHPSLHAGYTYLGQFIAHDISFTQQNVIPASHIPPDQIPQLRNPSLELDSLYGDGPESDKHRDLYEGGTSLKLGLTVGTGAGVTAPEYRNDLPRSEKKGPSYRRAIIADERNDDNLIVAQTQVAFMKFHNAVIADLNEKGVAANKLFSEARKKVVQHYQWIVLNDFLPKIIDEDVLKKVIQTYPSKHFDLQPGPKPFIPAEFAFAAFRFGHSLVRNVYNWNPINDRIGLMRLLSLTGKNGNLEATEALSSDWIIDWTRFYDFSGFGIPRNPKLNLARAVQTSLATSFKELPLREPRFLNDINPKNYRSIAALDLIRGHRAELPSGQKVAKLLNVDPLKPEVIADSPHKEFLEKCGFDKETPLWYYILKEAEIGLKTEVNHLGPIGSHIVAETFVGLIRASQFSILPQNGGEPVWKPDLGQKTKDQFGMADLLMFVQNKKLGKDDELNPLAP
jgi:Animal haem peroxidase